ncbi:MAG: secretin N-terminal domain-containing protein [Maricaulaceae bacterium]
MIAKNTKTKSRLFLKETLLCAGAIMLLPACQHMANSNDKMTKAQRDLPTLQDATLGKSIVRPQALSKNKSVRTSAPQNSGTNYSVAPTEIGAIPSIAEPISSRSSGNTRAPRSSVATINAFVAPLPVPQFIDVVYGEMLQVPFVPGKQVVSMTDVIQLRSSGEMKAQDFQVLVSQALEEYGVRVVPENGTYKIVKDEVLRSRIPKFIKSRARQRTRGDLRPVVQFVELNALNANEIYALLRDTFAKKQKTLSIQANPAANYITLSGLPEDVDAALAIILELDELNFVGKQVQRYTPRYWNAKEFSQVLTEALEVEGWEVTSNSRQQRTIFLMPVESSNDLFIFAKTKQAHDRVSKWIMDLDRPVQGGDTEQIFIYQVQNVDATTLAETANSVLSSRQQATGAAGVGLTGSVSGGVRSGSGAGDVFTVDPIGNRIVFTGTANDYDKMLSLLEQLDTPAPEVLIEAQIAEVTLNDSSSFGVEFFVDDLGSNSVSATAQTQGGLNLSGSGLNIALLSGNVDAAINAFASNRRVKLLSTPILVARSGTESELQVGQDVPIITAQQTANNQSGGGAADILQSIDYRKTGVLLSMEPIVFSDNRIDLTITQEVSSTVDAPNSAISSPTISNRSFTTQLSLEDGQTAVLGGLIQDSFTRDDKGVPFLKDIPGIGQVFSTDGFTRDRTELVILITAYVLRGQEDKNQFVNRLAGRVDGLLADEGRLITLKPRQF